MDSFIDIVIENLKNVNWEGPAAFIVVILMFFAIFRKWILVLLVVLTIVLGWGAQDLILLNLESENTVITVPLLVYLVGGVSVVLLSLFTFFKPK